MQKEKVNPTETGVKCLSTNEPQPDIGLVSEDGTYELFFDPGPPRATSKPTHALYAAKAKLYKQLREIDKRLDAEDNPCNCGKPSVRKIETRSSPREVYCQRRADGSWEFVHEGSGGDYEADDCEYLCEECSKSSEWGWWDWN